jgi:hypothetical protein
MYGNGIGTLSILLSDTRENKEREIWSLSGEAGNAWYQAELPISSPNSFMVCTSSDTLTLTGKLWMRRSVHHLAFAHFMHT